MKTWKLSLASSFIVALLVTATGCSGNVVEQASNLTDEMCKCTTPECAKGVESKMKDLGKKMKDKIKDLSADDQKKLMELGKKAHDCADKAEGGGDAPAPGGN